MKKILSCMAFLLCITQAQAAIINTEATLIDDNQLVIDYEVTAEVLDVATIMFFYTPTVFDNIRVSGNPDVSNWRVDVAQSADFFGSLEDGFVVFSAVSAPIALDETLSGFQVTVDIITATIPTELNHYATLFSMDDSFVGRYNLLIDSIGSDPHNVVAPQTFLLFILSLFGLLLCHYCRK